MSRGKREVMSFPWWHMFLGNHETETMNQMYGFEGEVKNKLV